jgi:hypothetical protein
MELARDFYKLFSVMLVSRMVSFGLLKCPHRLIVSYTRCCVSKLSHVSSPAKNDNLDSNDQKQSISTTKSIDNNNEWLWTYLRDRKTFSDLSEEQRRRVVEIG